MNAVASISGTTATKLLWPESSIPTTFTICAVTRYNGASRKRILGCYGSPTQTTVNWMHGQWDGKRGLSYYAGWKTLEASHGVVDDWLVMCGTNDAGVAPPGNHILDQDEMGTAAGGVGSGTLNIGYQSPYHSDWSLHSVLIWDYSLGTVPVPWHTRPCLCNLVAGSVHRTLPVLRFGDAWNCWGR